MQKRDACSDAMTPSKQALSCVKVLRSWTRSWKRPWGGVCQNRRKPCLRLISRASGATTSGTLPHQPLIRSGSRGLAPRTRGLRLCHIIGFQAVAIGIFTTSVRLN